jgi:hypothetical protein
MAPAVPAHQFLAAAARVDVPRLGLVAPAISIWRRMFSSTDRALGSTCARHCPLVMPPVSSSLIFFLSWPLPRKSGGRMLQRSWSLKGSFVVTPHHCSLASSPIGASSHKPHAPCEIVPPRPSIVSRLAGATCAGGGGLGRTYHGEVNGRAPAAQDPSEAGVASSLRSVGDFGRGGGARP